MRLIHKLVKTQALLVTAALVGTVLSAGSFAECSNPVRALVETASSTDEFPDALDTQYDRVMVIGKGANSPTIAMTAASCSTPPCECGREDISPYNLDSTNYPTTGTFRGTSHPMMIHTNRGKPNRVFASVYMKSSEENPGKKWGTIQKSQSTLGPCKLNDADGNTRYFFKATFCD